MGRYEANHKDKPISVVTLAGKEYKAKDGVIEVPDDHADAHRDAESIGLKHAAEKTDKK